MTDATAVMAAQLLTRSVKVGTRLACGVQSSWAKLLVRKKRDAYASCVNHLEPKAYSETSMVGGTSSKLKRTSSVVWVLDEH